MSFAMFLGTLAFFFGQGARVFSQSVRDTGLRPIPMIVLALTLFWLARVLFTNQK